MRLRNNFKQSRIHRTEFFFNFQLREQCYAAARNNRNVHDCDRNCDAALKLAANDFKAIKCKGFILEKLSELYLCQNQPMQAIESLKQAVATYHRAFSLTANDAVGLGYYGMVVERLGSLLFDQQQYTEAFETYQQALSIYDSAIKLSANDSENYALKAGVFTSLAELMLSLLQYTQAVEFYQQALGSYDTSLKLNYIKAVEFDKARTVQKLTQCLEQLLDYEKAFSCYQTVMEIFNRLLPASDKHIKLVEQLLQKLIAQLN